MENGRRHSHSPVRYQTVVQKESDDNQNAATFYSSCTAHQILWYRRGMGDWGSLGLTNLKPSDNQCQIW
jgi:hypothetical protein